MLHVVCMRAAVAVVHAGAVQCQHYIPTLLVLHMWYDFAYNDLAVLTILQDQALWASLLVAAHLHEPTVQDDTVQAKFVRYWCCSLTLCNAA